MAHCALRCELEALLAPRTQHLNRQIHSVLVAVTTEGLDLHGGLVIDGAVQVVWNQVLTLHDFLVLQVRRLVSMLLHALITKSLIRGDHAVVAL